MKTILFTFLLGASFLNLSAHPSLKMNGEDLADGKNIFERFLSCGRKLESSNPTDLSECMKPYLTNESISRSEQYEFIFRAKIHVTNLSQCSSERSKLIQGLEKSPYDIYLCFSTSYTGRDKVGTVFFKKEKNILKISNIKL